MYVYLALSKMLTIPAVVSLLFVFCARAQVRYSIPEEMAKGSVIGSIAEDLGMDDKRLRSGQARVIAGDSSRYVELDTNKGTLAVKGRIDRELLCKQLSPCSFSFEILLENPIQLFSVMVEITDVNDHAPTFLKNKKEVEISELALPGARFLLDSAFDPDVGENGIQSYNLKPSDHFVLKLESHPDGSKYVAMLLQKPLDRERQAEHSLLLTAVDGGRPHKSGTMTITVIVLDANDNPPVFTQPLYEVTLRENSPRGTSLITVSATDADAGSHGEVTYGFSDAADRDAALFHIDPKAGTISVLQNVDFESVHAYTVTVVAKDSGGLTDSCKVLIDVIDVNDNIPVISLTSFSSTISESSPPGTTVAVIHVKDLDSGENGRVKCSLPKILPFVINSSLANYYSILTGDWLDREAQSDYNITITATDEGSPPLTSQKAVHLTLSDINDNSPMFEQESYSVTVMENNSPGVSLLSVKAIDMDCCHNARISYILENSEISGVPASSIITVNAETGVISALKIFDYEYTKTFKIIVKAQDGGSPPLSSNATVHVCIQDQNDNAPQVLYPVQTGTSVLAEMVPRSAELGYLVTKVVALDVDSGQNAWLSYKLVKGTDRALFEVGLQNGEIRTIRPVSEKDGVKQKLTVVVEDNGQPSRSTTVNVNVVVADSFPEVLTEISDFTHEKDYNDSLTFYLILALAVVSFLFIVSLIAIISVKIHRWRQSRIFYQSNLPVIPYYPPLYADVDGTGTLRHVYNYEVCGTTDSRRCNMKFDSSSSESTLKASDVETLPHVQNRTETRDNIVILVSLNGKKNFCHLFCIDNIHDLNGTF